MAWLATVPDGATAQFLPGRCYGLDQTIVLADRSNLTIDGNGSTFRALTQSTNNQNRDNWRFLGGSNVTLRNAAIEGAYDGRFAAPTVDLEWQHGVRFDGVQTAKLDNVQISGVYGDFVEAEHDERQNIYTSPPSRNITVTNSHLSHSGRMGFGLTNVDGFTFSNSYLGDVGEAGIDIEPDIAQEVIRNVNIDGDTFGPIHYSVLSLGGWLADQTVSDISFASNVMAVPSETCQPPVYIGPPPSGVVDIPRLSITNNTLMTLSDGALLADVSNGTMTGNTVYFTNGGCDRLWGANLANVNGMTVANNLFLGAWASVHISAPSTGVVSLSNVP